MRLKSGFLLFWPATVVIESWGWMSSPFSFLWAFVQEGNGWHPYQGGADDKWFDFIHAFKPVTSIQPIIHCLALKLELDSCCRVKVIAICNLNLYLDSWQSYISVDPSEFEHVSYHLDKRKCEPKKIIRVDTVDITQSLLGLEDHFPFDKEPRCQMSKMAAYNVHCTGRSVNVQPHHDKKHMYDIQHLYGRIFTYNWGTWQYDDMNQFAASGEYWSLVDR